MSANVAASFVISIRTSSQEPKRGVKPLPRTVDGMARSAKFNSFHQWYFLEVP